MVSSNNNTTSYTVYVVPVNAQYGYWPKGVTNVRLDDDRRYMYFALDDSDVETLRNTDITCYFTGRPLELLTVQCPQGVNIRDYLMNIELRDKYDVDIVEAVFKPACNPNVNHRIDSDGNVVIELTVLNKNKMGMFSDRYKSNFIRLQIGKMVCDG